MEIPPLVQVENFVSRQAFPNIDLKCMSIKRVDFNTNPPDTSNMHQIHISRQNIYNHNQQIKVQPQTSIS